MTAVANWLAWLGDTTWSIALRESIWAYPIVETLHVLGLAVFAGLAIVVDLRLTGLALGSVGVSELVRRTSPFTWIGFGVMTLTGLLLFGADPVKFSANPYFRAKLLLLVVAGVNALVFHTTVYRHVAVWETSAVTPRRARLAGAISLAAWTAIIAAGRLIAFHAP